MIEEFVLTMNTLCHNCVTLLNPTSPVNLSANSQHWVVILRTERVYSTQDEIHNVIDLYRAIEEALTYHYLL